MNKRLFKKDELGRCDPSELTYAPWNPKRRIDATDPFFKALVRSIQLLGQLMPILINPLGLILEGNRRAAACEVLGVPVEYVCRDNADAFTIYSTVNSIRQNITANDRVEIFSKDKRALTEKQRKQVERISNKWGGIDSLAAYISSGGSVNGAEAALRLINITFGRIDNDKILIAKSYVERCGSPSLLKSIRRDTLQIPGLAQWFWDTYIVPMRKIPSPSCEVSYWLPKAFREATT